MTAPQRGTAFSFLRRMHAELILSYALVFVACFATAKFGQHIFFAKNISPAVIWPPFGIALGAMLVGGYSMWFPVALAILFATYSAGSPMAVVLAATIGQTLQPLIGAFAMNRLGFDRNFSRVRDAFTLIAAAFLITTIAPTIASTTGLLAHTLTTSFAISWSRAWAGGILSVLIVTPLITTWIPFRPFSLPRRELETALAFGALIVIIVFSAWTPYGNSFGLSDFYALLAVLTWISLRMRPRLMMLALFLLTFIDMAGIILMHSSATPLNQEIFSTELIIEILAVIFIVIAALAEERRVGRFALEKNVLELENALRRIESEDIAKNQFIATLAHELRNPLAPVVSALDLLELQNPSQESLPTIEGAKRELGVMRRLLDDILDVARVSQNRFRLQKEIVDVRPIIESCVASTRTFLKNRRHMLSVTLPQEPLMLEVDPVRFQQVIVNLLNNAGKYTPAGGQIELVCAKMGSQAMIRVRDNGIGIPQGSLQEIFEPFRQIRSTAQLGTGLGIGLWLTKQLVEMHGGSIEAESAGLARGSSFTIYLPLKEEAPMKIERKAAKKTLVIPPMKVLVVDDNEAAAHAMQKLLTLKGHEVRIAYNGESAIKETMEFLPQAILLDIGLPDRDGYEVARELRQIDPNGTLVALTGYGQEEDKSKAKNAGFDFHLTKPAGIADIEGIFAKIR